MIAILIAYSFATAEYEKQLWLLLGAGLALPALAARVPGAQRLPGGPMTRFRPLVLCYHAVSATWEHQLSSSPDAIARQLRLLLRWYRPVTAAEVLTEGRRALHVTFDDGFRSVTNVLPTLRRLGVPATIFVCSDYADSGRALEVTELRDEVAAHPDELATLRVGRGAGTRGATAWRSARTRRVILA